MYLIVVGNALSFIAYMLIPVTLLYLVWRRKDLVYNWMFLLFGAFIALCGLTHLFHIIIFSYPVYYIQATVSILTFAVSTGTAIMLFYIIPVIVTLTTPGQIEDINKKIAGEIERQKRAETDLAVKNKEYQDSNAKIKKQIEELAQLNQFMHGREERLLELENEVKKLNARS